MVRFRNSITIANIGVYPIRASGGVTPKMALGTMPTRPALLLRVEDTHGGYGWGEVWANFPPRANNHKAHIFEDVVAQSLKGQSFVEPREINLALLDALSVFFVHVGQVQVFEHILAGIDTALWDLALRNKGQSFADFMNLASPSAQSYATSINAEDLKRLIPKHAGLGQRYFKLKVGFADHGNREIVARAAKLCPDGARIMIDSNQAWDLQQAKSCLQTIQEFSPFFAEEPLPANAPLEVWEELANSTDIPLAGGENIYGIENFLSMINAGLRVVQPDVAKWGGVTGCLDLAKALPDGVILWPHFMGTAIGQVAALSISGAIGETSVCEVDVNENALRDELCGRPITIRDGSVGLPQDPGLVFEPDPKILNRFADTL